MENLEYVGCPMEVRSYVRPRRPRARGATTTIPSTWRAPVAKAVSRSRVPGVWFIELCFCGVWSLIPGEAHWLAGKGIRVPPQFLWCCSKICAGWWSNFDMSDFRGP